MKQNEKLLVYVVTGFLFVILAVAVIFGRGDDKPQSPTEKQTGAVQPGAASLEDMLNSSKSQAPAPEINLAANVQLAPPTPAEEVATMLGASRRERECRIVTARIGDSLGELVQRWCGNVEALPLAERMNEDVKLLRPGQEVVLPWVEDAEVLTAYRARPPKSETAKNDAAKPPPAGKGGAAPAPAVAKEGGAAQPAAFRTYVIKQGDKLWNIAEKEVGKSKARAFLERVRELNPHVDVDHLKVSQSIKLPARS